MTDKQKYLLNFVVERILAHEKDPAAIHELVRLRELFVSESHADDSRRDDNKTESIHCPQCNKASCENFCGVCGTDLRKPPWEHAVIAYHAAHGPDVEAEFIEEHLAEFVYKWAAAKWTGKPQQPMA